MSAQSSEAIAREASRRAGWPRPWGALQSRSPGVAVAPERAASRAGLKLAFAVWLSVRIVLSLWGAFIMAVAPADSHAHILRDYPDVVLPNPDLYGYTIGVWNIYDTHHYITIAERGYEADPGWLPAYFPAYPILIKLASPLLLGDSLLAAMLIANLCALIFFWYLYRLVEPDFGADVATRAVILSAIFPASFYLFMGYTEAPLLAFMVASLYYARHKNWWLAGLLAGAAALTKQPGIFLLLPLAYIYWQQQRGQSLWSYFKKPQWAWLLLCPLAALSYTLYRYLYVSAPIADVADVGGSQRLTFPGLPLLYALQAIGPDNPLLPYNLMDIGFTLLMVALVAGVALKVRSTTLTLYALVICLTNLCIYMWTYEYRPEVNMPRRMLIIFPIFVFLALVTPNKRVFRIVAYTSFALFLCLSGLWTNWIFVS